MRNRVASMLALSILVVAAGAAAMEVERVAVCTAVEEREPVGGGELFGSDVGRVYCFSELAGVEADEVIHHVWYWEGTEVARIPLPVQAGRFRTWSLKTIPSAWTGSWRVVVENAAGDALAEVTFKIAS
jgi:hypothetical protein